MCILVTIYLSESDLVVHACIHLAIGEGDNYFQYFRILFLVPNERKKQKYVVVHADRL